MLFLVGPTGVGKSDIAAAVAARCNSEIIGADAFQIYEGMDILTAKPSRELREKIPHHLIGAVPISRSFDAAQYAEAARRCAAEIEARGKLPIVVGGTGLYVRALTHALAELPRADAAIRTELERASLGDLQRRLAEFDPIGAGKIDAKNKRRLVRAIEVCLLTGKPFSSLREDWSQLEAGVSPTQREAGVSPAQDAAALSHPTIEPSRRRLHVRAAAGFFLTRDRDELYERIDRRVEEMFRAGVVEEVRRLPDAGPTASQALGLRDVRAFLHGEISEIECIERIQRATRHYAKRQLTWFTRESIFEPLNLSALPFQSAVERISREFISAARLSRNVRDPGAQ
jgi:tRNA dimethylallyltransferase